MKSIFTVINIIRNKTKSADAHAHTDLQTRSRRRGSVGTRWCRCLPLLPSQSSWRLRPPIRYPNPPPLPQTRRPAPALSPPVQSRPFHNSGARKQPKFSEGLTRRGARPSRFVKAAGVQRALSQLARINKEFIKTFFFLRVWKKRKWLQDNGLRVPLLGTWDQHRKESKRKLPNQNGNYRKNTR